MRWLFFFSLIVAVASFGYWVFYADNIASTDRRPVLNIPTGSSMVDVEQLLVERHIVKQIESFRLTAVIKGYSTALPGHYVFNRRMNNREIVNMLQGGLQTPVHLNIYNIRTKEDFAGLVDRTLEIDSITWLSLLNDTAYCNAKGVDTSTILTHFVADNYELRWNTTLEELLMTMDTAFRQFWTDERLNGGAALDMTPTEITILASIVEKECIHDSELPRVAGVYLNRLHRGMPLQADPTIVFARRDFAAQRVTDYHKDYDSPYNTYLYKGLPPGPICLPRKKSIDAVLHAEEHDYLYFCAKPDMSGYSVFSHTLEEQNRVAASYRRVLNERNIH